MECSPAPGPRVETVSRSPVTGAGQQEFANPVLRALTAIGYAALLASISLATITVDAGAADEPGGSRESPAASDYERARTLVANGDYPGAIVRLEQLLAREPRSADALNLMGYSHRKLGELNAALEFYQKALAIEPEHRGANEYLGELYLETDRLAEAEQRLAVLDKACFLPCEEHTDLKHAIAAYKQEKGIE